MGWSALVRMVVTRIADLVAITGYAGLSGQLANLGPGLGHGRLILSVNLFSVRHFGELEFWFALIKVAAIRVPRIAVGAILVATNFVSLMVCATIRTCGNARVLPRQVSWAWSVATDRVFLRLPSVLGSLACRAAETADPCCPHRFPTARSMPCRCGSRCSSEIALLAVWPSCRGGSSPVASPFGRVFSNSQDLPLRRRSSTSSWSGRTFRRVNEPASSSPPGANAFRPRRRRPRSGAFTNSIATAACAHRLRWRLRCARWGLTAYSRYALTNICRSVGD